MNLTLAPTLSISLHLLCSGLERPQNDPRKIFFLLDLPLAHLQETQTQVVALENELRNLDTNPKRKSFKNIPGTVEGSSFF
jgi:hypothetical protein